MIRSFFLLFLSCFCLFAEGSLTSKISLNLWQTYKTKDLPEGALEAQSTWLNLNPEFTYHLWDDEDIKIYISQNWDFAYLDFFQSLPVGAMKADLWRYMILVTEGGVYTDLDSLCLLPIHCWPVKHCKSTSHLLVLDLDIDQSQFCQWTIACTPHHPAMKYVCNYLIKKWKRKWKNKGFPANKDGTIDVLSTTGPKAFTKAIKEYIDESKKMTAIQIRKKYAKDKKYRKRLNRLGIYFIEKGFFNGKGSQNLFWGSSHYLDEDYESWSQQI